MIAQDSGTHTGGGGSRTTTTTTGGSSSSSSSSGGGAAPRADSTLSPGTGSGVGSIGGGMNGSLGSALPSHLIPDMGGDPGQLGDAPPPQPVHHAIAPDFSSLPDITTTTALEDPATTWRDESRFHQLAADSVGLQHV